MSPVLFVLLLGTLSALVLAFAFKTLPQERWQVFAAVPILKTPKGNWSGLNLTYYGLFVATAEMVAMVILTVLMASAGVSINVVAAFISIVIGLCVPSSRWIARLVDRRKYNFTIAGAVAAGMIVVPLAAALIRTTGHSISTAIVFASTAVAYSFGEGLGRLACISFGCCYGKPLRATSQRIQNLFTRCHFVFNGATKKIAYESGLDGVAVVPIQAVTCCAHLVIGLIAMLIFLKGFIIAAFLISTVTTLLWRIYSETLRADYRGEGRISKYQIMSAAGIVYTTVVAALVADPTVQPNLSKGLTALWNPSVIVFYQMLWWALFLFHGRSKVTSSEISIRVEADRI